jgi:hypothetical protein
MNLRKIIFEADYKEIYRFGIKVSFVMSFYTSLIIK